MNFTGWRWLLLGPGGFSGAEDLCRAEKEWGRGCIWEPARRERSEAPGRNQVKLETFQKVRIDLKIFYLKVSFTKYLLAEASSWPITSSRWWPTKATWKNMKIHHNYQIWIISYDIYIYTIHIIYEYILWKYVKVCKNVIIVTFTSSFSLRICSMTSDELYMCEVPATKIGVT